MEEDTEKTASDLCAELIARINMDRAAAANESDQGWKNDLLQAYELAQRCQTFLGGAPIPKFGAVNSMA